MKNIKNQDEKQNKWSLLGTILLILVISTIITTILLAIHLIEYIKIDDREVLLNSNMETELDLFSVQYHNASGEITVEGMDGQAVVAPGTSVEYTIRLRNKDKVALDYELIPAVTLTSEHDIPVLVRMLDADGNYIIGDAKTWVTIEDIGNNVVRSTLLRGESTEFFFQWKWDFESGNDAYDTFLGNLTADVNVGVEVKMELLATANTTISLNGGFARAPQFRIIMLTIAAILLLLAIIFLWIYGKRDKAPQTIEVVKTVEVPVVQTITASAPVVQTKKIGFTGKMAYVNIDTLDENFNSGDRITLGILKQKGIIPDSTKQIKILSRLEKPLEKAFIIETQGISKEAEIAIRCAGGKVVITAPDSGKGDAEQ